MTARSAGRGRRPGANDTRVAVRAAALELFADHGFHETSVRKIARHAGVDPALVHYFFGSKAALFDDAVRLPRNPAQLCPTRLRPGSGGIGERLARAVIELWDDPATRAPALALLRSAGGHPAASGRLRDAVLRHVLPLVAAGPSTPTAERSCHLVAGQLVGTMLARYVWMLEPLVSLDRDELARLIGPALEAQLLGADQIAGGYEELLGASQCDHRT